jgi:hypothetical protein
MGAPWTLRVVILSRPYYQLFAGGLVSDNWRLRAMRGASFSGHHYLSLLRNDFAYAQTQESGNPNPKIKLLTGEEL